jgi:hypothetical protein
VWQGQVIMAQVWPAQLDHTTQAFACNPAGEDVQDASLPAFLLTQTVTVVIVLAAAGP